MVDSILEGLTRQDPANKDFYAQNAAAYKTKLQALDEKFKNTLSGCRKDTFVHSGHFAFNYLASRYNLHYISAYGGSPNAEPTPGKIIELKKFILEHAVKYIYYEELITPRIADILNKETGARLLKLNGAHNIGKDDLKEGKTFHRAYGRKSHKSKGWSRMSITVLSSEGLHFQYNGIEILTDISFQIQAGDYVGIVGPMASGKTTLIKLALGFFKPARGKILLFGRTTG